MPASLPVSPFGRVTLTAFSSCWPSARTMRTLNGLKAPAWELSDDAEYPGAKARWASVCGQLPPDGSLVSVKLLVGSFLSGTPDQGLISDVVVLGPQVGCEVR